MDNNKGSIRTNIHSIANGLQNAFETIENVGKFYDSDPKYCHEALKAAIEERNKTFDAIKDLRSKLKKMGVYDN